MWSWRKTILKQVSHEDIKINTKNFVKEKLQHYKILLDCPFILSFLFPLHVNIIIPSGGQPLNQRCCERVALFTHIWIFKLHNTIFSPLSLNTNQRAFQFSIIKLFLTKLYSIWDIMSGIEGTFFGEFPPLYTFTSMFYWSIFPRDIIEGIYLRILFIWLYEKILKPLKDFFFKVDKESLYKRNHYKSVNAAITNS